MSLSCSRPPSGFLHHWCKSQRWDAHSDLVRAPLIPHPLLLLPVPQACRARFHSRTSVLVILSTQNAPPKCAYTHSPPAGLTPCRSHSNATWTQRSSLTTPATLLPSTLVHSPSWFSWPPHTLYTHIFFSSVSLPLQSKLHGRKDSIYNGSVV